MKTFLKSGIGYWRLNYYPIGGEFCRKNIPLEILQIQRDYKKEGIPATACKGCTHQVKLSNGDIAAINMQYTYTE